MKGQVDRERCSRVWALAAMLGRDDSEELRLVAMPGRDDSQKLRTVAMPEPGVSEKLRTAAMLEPVPEPRTALKAQVRSDPGRRILEEPLERPMVARVRGPEPW